MLFKFLIKIGLMYPSLFIKILYKQEYGVAIFCRKISDKAYKLGYSDLSTELLEHSKQEELHGKMLSSFIEKTNRFTTSDNGYWEQLTLSNGKELVKVLEKPLSKPITWDSLKYPGYKLTGYFKNLDGLSKSFWAYRLFFGDLKAEEFSLDDQLAFMHILESQTVLFYTQLSKEKGSLGSLATKILADEKYHKSYLIDYLDKISNDPKALIKKWNRKLLLLKLGVVIDIINLLIKK